MIRADWRGHTLAALRYLLRSAQPRFREVKQSVRSEGHSTRSFKSGGNHRPARGAPAEPERTKMAHMPGKKLRDSRP